MSMSRPSLTFAWNTVRSEAALPQFEPGWVWLVGAGPGDAGLLTLHALNALQQADIVVYDALVDEGILKLARPGAVVEYAGKRGGKPSPKQRDISLRLIEWARAGKRVLRLKGGDPFLFGRGGEEAIELAAAGIAFEVVPGITSAQGCAARLRMPLTHREVATGVRFVTGHCRSDRPLDLDWKGLADGNTTVVVYMGLANIAEIAAELMAHGRGGDTPVCAVSKGTQRDQAHIVSRLDRIATDAAAAALPSPVLFIIGEVVNLAATIGNASHAFAEDIGLGAR